MTATMTDRQIHWARQHDWYQSHDSNGVVTVREIALDRANKSTLRLLRFDSFRELYQWAGY